MLSDVGLVSAAMFADINGDGHPDLVLAREWGSILAAAQRRTRAASSPAPDSWGLDKWTSRWNGIAAGDLDGDGRLDLVATSWGRNTAAQADSADPLVLLYGPIRRGAAKRRCCSRKNDPRVTRSAPLNSYARVRVAMPDLVSARPTFARVRRRDASTRCSGPHIEPTCSA